MLGTPNILYGDVKINFVTHFEDEFAKKVAEIATSRGAEDVAQYASNRFNLARQLFPSLTQRELNMFVLSAFGAQVVSKCKSFFHVETSTMIEMLKLVVGETDLMNASLVHSHQMPPTVSRSSTPVPSTSGTLAFGNHRITFPLSFATTL